MTRAPWNRRIAARFIDVALLAGPVLLIGLLGGIIGAGVAGVGGRNDLETTFAIIASVAAFLACAGYEAVLVTRWRATVGKRALGLQVAPAAAGGEQGPLPVAASAAWAALLWLPVIFAFILPTMLSLAGVAAVLFGIFGLHDRVAGTVVLGTAPAASEDARS